MAKGTLCLLPTPPQSALRVATAAEGRYCLLPRPSEPEGRASRWQLTEADEAELIGGC